MRAPLDEVQAFLAGAFQREAPVVDDPALASACGRHVSGNDRLTPAEQVDIYRRQFWLRHFDSIRDDHPGLAHVLGEDDFEAFCRAFLAACPPRTPSLRDLTADVVAFAEGYPAFPSGRRGLAVDMVRYEHAFVDLFDGADVPPLDPHKLAGVPESAWETARIVLHPLLVPMRLGWPVHRIRYAVREGKEPAVPDAPEPVTLALFRKALVIHYEELEPLAFELLVALERGTALVPAMAAVAEGLAPDTAAALEASVGGWFQQWAGWGWIVDVEVPA